MVKDKFLVKSIAMNKALSKNPTLISGVFFDEQKKPVRCFSISNVCIYLVN
jgi:hypothetical protein